jgi:hypothetical protein
MITQSEKMLFTQSSRLEFFFHTTPTKVISASKANNNAYQMHKVLYKLKCKLYINPSFGALIFPKENEVRRTKRRGRRGGAFKTLSRHYKQSWQPKSPW